MANLKETQICQFSTINNFKENTFFPKTFRILITYHRVKQIESDIWWNNCNHSEYKGHYWNKAKSNKPIKNKKRLNFETQTLQRVYIKEPDIFPLFILTKSHRDVLFKFHLQFWNTNSIGIPVRSMEDRLLNGLTAQQKDVFDSLSH